MRFLRALFFAVVLCDPIAPALATGPAPAKPDSAPGNGDDPAQRRAAADRRAEEERSRPIRGAIEARDRADLARSDYESAHKPGAVPKEARESFDHVIALYEKAIDRPLDSPELTEVVSYCYLRLAGAYQYTGQMDKAVEQAKKAVDAVAGTPQEVAAAHNVGLVYLQARHDPNEALVWFKKARELVGTALKDPQEQSKWISATDEAIRRCDREAGH